MIRIIALLLGTVFLVGCNDTSRYSRNFELDEATFDNEAMQMIRDDTGISIPSGSRGLNFSYKPPVDPAFLARIEIPDSSKEFIIKELDRLRGREIEVHGGLSSKVSWWLPNSGKVILDKQIFDEARGTSLHCVFTSENSKLILYLDYST